MVIAILTLCFLSAMMQNKCVVKVEEEKKKKCRRKGDSFPTSESSCGAFTAVNL